MKKKLIILPIILILFFFSFNTLPFEYTAEETNIYDPDSLVVLEILDSSGFSHDYFDDVIWVLVKENVNDSDWRICRLYLEAGDMQSLPPILPGKLNCLPKSIGNLFYLNWLEIPYHNLESIPNEINKLEYIQILDLRYNPLKEIQAEIAQCERLLYIGLAYTNITSLPNEFLDLGLRPCNIAVDTINGNIYPQGVIDLCGLENFTLTEQQKLWADVADYAEYEEKYCQQTNIVIHDKKYKPNDFIVSNNYGNTSIHYTIPYSTSVKIKAYDIKGKLVKIIQDRFMLKGYYSVNWDSMRFGSGVYFLKLSVNGSAVSKKFTIIK